VVKVALVTGGSKGIGYACAERLMADGFAVAICARNGQEVTEAASRLGGPSRVLGLRSDVGSVDDCAGLVPAVLDHFGRLDVLVNNAGAYFDVDQAAISADLAIVQAALDVNLLGPWRLCEAFVPLMLQQGYGRIVNVSSGGGAFAEAGAGTPAYSVSKAGLNMLTVKLAAELVGSGVLVNAACPGWVRTAMGGTGAPRSPEEGADTPLWLATLPADGPSGGFFRDRQRIPW
jgi:NAD(P)-dependent dehydrogenase (short-subunit alcohol dehydrogenase family)